MIFSIDPSLTGTAVCLWDPLKHEPDLVRRFESDATHTLVDRIRRYRRLVRSVLSCFDFAKVTLILIEGYSMGSKGAAVTGLAEYGGILRNQLVRKDGPPVIEVSPHSLKKFATGKGNCNKGFVQAHVARRWQIIYETDDEIDAYVLARMGLCYLDDAAFETTGQREVIDKLKNPVGKSKKKRKAKNDG
jgi:crossover junction endodeoxyribonuclease RuvC